MDLSHADMTVLAPQLRKPEGEMGRRVGEAMAEKNMEVTAFTLSCIHVEPTDSVLEIGFGPGEGIEQAVHLTPDGSVSGIDYSEEMVKMAMDRNRRSLLEQRVDLTLGEARKMPYDDASFDKIFAVNVFHFWPDPAEELAECMRVLKSGGRVAFFMAYPSSWLPGLRETGVFIPREPEDVERALRSAGFGRTESHTITLDLFRGFVSIGTKA